MTVDVVFAWVAPADRAVAECSAVCAPCWERLKPEGKWRWVALSTHLPARPPADAEASELRCVGCDGLVWSYAGSDSPASSEAPKSEPAPDDGAPDLAREEGQEAADALAGRWEAEGEPLELDLHGAAPRRRSAYSEE